MSDETANQEAQPTEEQAPSQEPSAIDKALGEITRLREEQAQRDQIIARVASQRYQAPAQQPDPTPAYDPEEIDPAVKAMVEAETRQLREMYTQDLQQRDQLTMERAADHERERLLMDLRAAGKEEMIKDVDAYMDNNGVPLHLRASRNSYREALNNIVGSRSTQEMLRPSAPSAPPAQGPPLDTPPVHDPVADYEAARLQRKMGVAVVDKDEIELFDNNSVSVDEYQELLLKRAAKEKKR